jgi:hypothetical protein
MNHSRSLTTVCCLLAAALLAVAQTPPPAPPPPAATAPVAPLPPDAGVQTPTPVPMPAPAPFPVAAPMAPLPPMDIDLGDLDFEISLAKELTLQIDPDLQDNVEAMREQAERMKPDMQERAKALTMSPDLQEKVEALREQAERMSLGIQDQVAAKSLKMSPFLQEQMEAVKEQMGRMKLDMAFAPQAIAPRAPTPPTPPMPPLKAGTFHGMIDDSFYARGQSALDNRHWDEAVEYFGQVISRGGSRVDGALYWKAYALGKLGRRDEAAATIAELRKGYAGSRWLDDAKALELELKQAAGQNVAPEAESDEELKLMAINGLMQSDPERAIPLLERQLKGSASPKVKRNTLFVLAQSNSPKAQALIEQVARGGANPDLQLKAIGYMNERRKPNNNGQILSEIYAATNDLAVKRAVLQMYAGMREKDRLLQAARTEKTPELRDAAIAYLAGTSGTPELWQLYQTETTTEGKLQLLRYMHGDGSGDKLLEAVRTEKDPKVRAAAMRALASQRTGVSADALVTLYNAEQDSQIKLSIVDGLCAQRNAKALVDIARGEKDTKMKLRIVERLSNIKSKESNDYLEELLKK